jgi:hypothetical protein
MVVVSLVLATACTAGARTPDQSLDASGVASVGAAPSAGATAALPAPTAVPSPTAAPIAWSPASLEQDWPAPVRKEQAGDPTVEPLTDQYWDPAGDTESDAFPWVDIRAVSSREHSVTFWVPGGAPDVDPAEQWIAYGLVADDDGDGVADRRYGMDNIPGPVAWGHPPHRAWMTDLHTGRTESSLLYSKDYDEHHDGTIDTMLGDTMLGTYFPFAENAIPGPSCDAGVQASMRGLSGLSGSHLTFGGGDVAGGGRTPGAVPARFYMWASMIVNGRVVATDYAPDSGWFHQVSKDAPGDPDIAPPIDSLDKAVAYVGQTDPKLNGFLATDTHVPGASAWIEPVARGNGWDITYVCGETGIDRAYARYHVGRDGTIDALCHWRDVTMGEPSC